MVMKILRDKRGFGIVAALIVMLLFAFLSTAIYVYSNSQLKVSQKLEQMENADYLARTGIEATAKAYSELSEIERNNGAAHKLEARYTYIVDDPASNEPIYYTYTGWTNSYIRYDDGVHNPSFPTYTDAMNLQKMDILGYFQTTAEYPIIETIDGSSFETVNFKSTAYYGGVTTITSDIPTNTDGSTAVAEAYFPVEMTGIDAYAEGWYTDEGVAITGNKSYTNSLGGSTTVLWSNYGSQTDSEGNVANIMGHSVPGTLTFKQPNSLTNEEFTLPVVSTTENHWLWGSREVVSVSQTNNSNKITYIADQIYFDLPINLYTPTNGINNFLMLSGGDIVINGEVELYLYYKLIASSARSGTMAISCPEGDFPYVDPVTGRTAAKVYFNADVSMSAQSLFNQGRAQLFSAGEVYYFYQDVAGVNDNSNTIDFVKLWNDTISDEEKDDFSWLTGELIDYYKNNGSGETYEMFDGSNASTADMRKIEPGKYLDPATGASLDLPTDLAPPQTSSAQFLTWK